ncbi:MAG: CRISPR-associated protein Cas4 [Lachnospiraceae bacterium]|nr:CRISPR-associated protein Cas4 [Lachnospiraceae bacterium]
MENISIAIRNIQHYLYCPHRFGLIMIDDIWAENYFVTKSNIMHERVHSNTEYSIRGKKVLTSVAIYNDDSNYNIYGYVDCIEIEHNDMQKIKIVEYKPKMPKDKDFNYEDLMQVFAQKICVDKMFNCNSEGIIYYKSENKRITLPLVDNFEYYNEQLKIILIEMRQYIVKGEIPRIINMDKCGGCSMKDLCMPKTYNKHYNVFNELYNQRHNL